ncbi:Aste57867_9124 [Aphanomyces stellatus]|uniref:Aste57867_9124 protein n=1 Tax=Aphanomyces stellatus TaxID=120398 RepID=A0A485KMA1_9STRA|nr:hypothetical protein As57867_009088 [Aphanomyces stellatus]VFT86008.1 Aste57867_9124 [Aphanomyces stellatus]
MRPSIAIALALATSSSFFVHPVVHGQTNAVVDPDLLVDDVPLNGDDAADVFIPEVNGCNGYVAYCTQTIDKVFWPGAHNSLTDAGFALQRNQYVSGPKLLDAGIRYFDIDTCAYMNVQGKRMAPMVCHGYEWYLAQIYQPTLTGILGIKQWLDVHPREVVVLNFGDIGDFTSINARGLAMSTPQLRMELVAVVRKVFGAMAILRHDPWDVAIGAGTATLQDLIAANRRVLVNIGISASDNPMYWGQSDRVCSNAWYDAPLQLNAKNRTDYDWAPVFAEIEQDMRAPCAAAPKLLNKLEFDFTTALSGIIDANTVGVTLATYLHTLELQNRAARQPPYFPFNMILLDHADKWSSYYAAWHATHIDYLSNL